MKRSIYVLLIACILILSACNPGVSDDKLIIYTNSGSDGRAEWLAEEAKKAGFNIKVVQMGGNTLANRIIAEKTNPIADITYGMSQMDWQKVKENNGLISYKPKWANETDKKTPFTDKDYAFNPVVEQRIVQIYNQHVYDQKTAPHSYKEMINNPKYKGKYAVPSSLGGLTDRTVIMSILAPYIDEKDPKAELGVKPEGWKLLKKYIDNGYITPDGEDKTQNLVEKNVPLSYHFSSGIPGIEKEFKFKAGLISPKEGVPSTIESVGIMNKGKDHDYTQAKKFIDWFGSSEVQEAWSKKFGTYPTNQQARKNVDTSMQRIIDKTHPQNIDYDVVNKYIDQWVEKVELEFY
ncbi:extracellular solute-binding protein [Staphylococcus hominis]|uniref:extracellular solute-binding protein n=1 Tax=Staphylococcus hominis TaxID=1290 RepID=UPI003EB6A9BF